jgi:hypothetical protein
VRTPLLKDDLLLPAEPGHLQIPPAIAGAPNEAEGHQLLQFISDFYYKGTMARGVSILLQED